MFTTTGRGRRVVIVIVRSLYWLQLGVVGVDLAFPELVAAKAWVPVVSPTASDLSIDYANVPWMFRVMPSDGAQAKALPRPASTGAPPSKRTVTAAF